MNNDLTNAASALKDDAVQFTQRGNYFGRPQFTKASRQ
jgi:hypothetical protein